ncbi:phospholipase D-like domain-containing protein [Autumnicola musiva]|uniref:phospholipase D n=1 Tax=Autumnicola musiva TaxID=3075589 RepID=A0ABU3DAD1_9FLAO|nr:phospholipase D-like domain-containing protein [Zunongwangia sp. F117]MDT0678491.1 phospholipase D-like domain-containing protein [Zunongwangia sp. F117]
MNIKRIITRNYFYLFLVLTFFSSCETDDGFNTEEGTEEQEVIDHPVKQIVIDLPEVTFTDPIKIAAGNPSLTIMNRMIELVDATPSGETIHISVYSFHDFPQFVSAIERADSRGVSVNIMVDVSAHDQNHVENNRTYMEEMENLANVNFVGVNNTAGAIAINHNKFMLISEIEAEGGSINNIVHQSSHNFTEYDTRRIQDAVTLSNEGLYNAYLDYYNDTKQLAGQGMENYEYREYEEDITAFFYPRRNGGQIGDDNIIGVLNNITNPSSTSIKIGMSGWSPSRISILRKLEELHNEGATVEIITKSNLNASLQEELRNFASDGAFVKIYDDINIHSKFMIIEGNWNGQQTDLVLMGSQNFTNNAYKYNNETTLMFQDHQFFEAYRNYFEELKLLPGICCSGEDEDEEEEEENPDMNYLVTEDFDTYDLAGESTDLNGLGNASNGWGDSWEKDSGSFLLQNGNIPTDGEDGGNHAVTTSGEENINYYRSLADNWGNYENTTYWLGFYVNPEQPASWSGLGLYKGDISLALIGTPYNTEQQGVAGMQGPNLTIEGSNSSDKTWFVAKMEMSGAGGTPHFYLWRNPDPNSEPNIEDADLDFPWPDGSEGFNRIRIGNNYRNNASIGYDHIRLSKNYEDIVFQN